VKEVKRNMATKEVKPQRIGRGGAVRWVVLGAAALFGVLLLTGCNGATAQNPSADELARQQQENADLQKQIEDLEDEQDERNQDDLQRQIDELEEQDKEDKHATKRVVVQHDYAAPDEAPEGVVALDPGYDVGVATQDEVAVLDAANSYYAAAELGDYETTWSLLSGDDQAMYPLGDWQQANTNLDSASGEFVVYNVEPVPGDPSFYNVDLTVFMADGSSFDRRTMFHWESYWAHWLTDEEMSMFDGALV
jgi:cell division protein FtsB